jgi:hypothetical protein
MQSINSGTKRTHFCDGVSFQRQNKPPLFSDETYEDVKKFKFSKQGCIVRGQIVRGLIVQGCNIQGRIILKPN